MLSDANIDTAIFSGHSTRMAASSKAAWKGVGTHTILQTAGWESDLRDIDTKDKTVRQEFADAIFSRS